MTTNDLMQIHLAFETLIFLRDGAPWPEGEVTLLIGAEREGLPTDVVAAASEARSIAIDGDSLNAAMAATIALYSCTRKV